MKLATGTRAGVAEWVSVISYTKEVQLLGRAHAQVRAQCPGGGVQEAANGLIDGPSLPSPSLSQISKSFFLMAAEAMNTGSLRTTSQIQASVFSSVNRQLGPNHREVILVIIASRKETMWAMPGSF